MKTKGIITGILSTAVCLSLLTACGTTTSTSSLSSEQKSELSAADASEPSAVSAVSTASESSSEKEADQTSVTPTADKNLLTVKDMGKNAAITATFSNSATGVSEDVPMEKTGEGDGYFLYTCTADTEKYNLVHLSYGDKVTKEAAFNPCVSGWELYEGELMPFDIQSDKALDIQYDTQVFNVSGLEKKAYIWTPADYDANAAEKYSVIYMLDGQTVLTTDISGAARSWNVAEHTASMMSATGNKAILVCLDAGDMRADDYAPVLSGDATCYSSSNPCGNLFGNYVCETVMPYIQEHYNVYTDAAHTALAGSSLGGLEAFYIGLEHADQFGTIGIFSPSFWAYDTEAWQAYFAGKTFDGNCAFLYFYSGSFGQDTGYWAEPTYNALLEAGYPKDKLVFSKYEDGKHNEEYWSDIYPEFLEAVVAGKVSALECGVPVTYIDRTPPERTEAEPSDDISTEPDTRPDYIKNYIFFDNSELKWEKVCAYWFDLTMETPVNKATGEDNYGSPIWPGTEMEQIEGTDIYRIAAPLGVTAIIFSNGILDKDVLQGVTAYQTVDLIYSDAACSGKMYQIDTSVEAVQGTGRTKTKFGYPAGKWVPYEP